MSHNNEKEQDKNLWLQLSKQKFITHHTPESKTMWRLYCSGCKIPICNLCSIVEQNFQIDRQNLQNTKSFSCRND